MDYGNIPEDLLEVELGEFYNADLGFSRLSLKAELDTIDEPIVHANWELETKDLYPRLKSFVAWTEDKVLILITDQLDQQNIIAVPKQPVI